MSHSRICTAQLSETVVAQAGSRVLATETSFQTPAKENSSLRAYKATVHQHQWQEMSTHRAVLAHTHEVGTPLKGQVEQVTDTQTGIPVALALARQAQSEGHCVHLSVCIRQLRSFVSRAQRQVRGCHLHHRTAGHCISVPTQTHLQHPMRYRCVTAAGFVNAHHLHTEVAHVCDRTAFSHALPPNPSLACCREQ